MGAWREVAEAGTIDPPLVQEEGREKEPGMVAFGSH